MSDGGPVLPKVQSDPRREEEEVEGGVLMTNGCLSSIADGALASAVGLLNGFILSFTLQGLQQPHPSVCPGWGRMGGEGGGDGTVGL